MTDLAGAGVREYELAEIGEVAGRDLLHLHCGDGADSLALARLGARVTGADSDREVVAAAQEAAAAEDVDARFVVGAATEVGGDYDVVYAARGVLAEVGDLGAWAGAVARLLRPGGVLYLTDAHPLVWVFDDLLRARHPYEQGLGEVVSALCAAGLVLDLLHELPFLEYALPFLRRDPRDDTWRLREENAGDLPLSFSLKAHRP